MTETTSNNVTLEQLQAMLAAQLPAQGVGIAPQVPMGVWGQAQKPASATSVSIPIEFETPIGKVRAYLHYGPEHAATPDTLLALIQQLSMTGWPIAAWQKQESQGGWGQQKQGGFGGGGGGYQKPFNNYRRY